MSHRHPPHKPKVLVVEDELIVARDIGQLLLELGYEPVGHAARGEQAVTLAGELLPDLVLMDVQLAGAMDGIEAAREIRRRFALPVVFLTAFAADETLARAKLAEPFGYVIKPFNERDLRTVLEMALYKHAAEAKLQDYASQLKALSRRVLEFQEIERASVARELHEEVGQALAAIKINLQAPDRAGAHADQQENLRIVDGALRHVRSMALALRPSMLDDLGLGPALRWLAEQSATQGGVAVRVRVAESVMRMEASIETACFRIAQEALSNVVRHARARLVRVYLYRNGPMLVMGIKDDGEGFDPAVVTSRASAGEHLGVLGMRERAAFIGGLIDIRSRPGKGCTVRLRCPWTAR